MQLHKPACEECQDTGSLDKTLWGGDLDCTYCQSAAQRAGLRKAVRAAGANYFDAESLGWFCYLQGQQSQQTKLQAMAMHLRRMWGWAIQIGGEFRPGMDDLEKADWRKQCDEAIALLREYPPQQQSKLEE